MKQVEQNETNFIDIFNTPAYTQKSCIKILM